MCCGIPELETNAPKTFEKPATVDQPSRMLDMQLATFLIKYNTEARTIGKRELTMADLRENGEAYCAALLEKSNKIQRGKPLTTTKTGLTKPQPAHINDVQSACFTFGYNPALHQTAPGSAIPAITGHPSLGSDLFQHQAASFSILGAANGTPNAAAPIIQFPQPVHLEVPTTGPPAYSGSIPAEGNTILPYPVYSWELTNSIPRSNSVVPSFNAQASTATTNVQAYRSHPIPVDASGSLRNYVSSLRSPTVGFR
jgi:hypothetical protein